MRILVVVAAALGTTGCHNACQDICLELAKYAEDECGFVVSDAEIDECLDAQAGKESADDRAACREYGNPRSIEEEWGCEELEGYFSEAGE